MQFIVRVAATLARKPQVVGTATAAAATPPRNPFLPYDPAMFVQDLAPNHVALLNKFAVVPNHFVVVTKGPRRARQPRLRVCMLNTFWGLRPLDCAGFERQTDPLTAVDLDAVWRCLRELPALAFFNCGVHSGARSGWDTGWDTDRTGAGLGAGTAALAIVVKKDRGPDHRCQEGPRP